MDVSALESLEKVQSVNNHSRNNLPAASDSLKSFLFGIKAKETRKRYLAQLPYFFDFLGITGTLEEQATKFLLIAGGDPKYAYDCMIEYVTNLRNRVDTNEITGGTTGNYYSVAKLFLQQNDIELNWRKIERGLP